MNIPKGYRVTFHTWENDADHWKELSLNSLTYNDVRFFLNLSKYFKSCSSDESLLGNRSVTMEEILKVFKISLDEFAPDIEVQKEIDDLLSSDDEYHRYEWLIENILGYTVEYHSEETYCRVIDHCEVHYYPSEVKDVTETDFSEFKCSQPNFFTVQEPLANQA